MRPSLTLIDDLRHFHAAYMKANRRPPAVLRLSPSDAIAYERFVLGAARKPRGPYRLYYLGALVETDPLGGAPRFV